MLTAITRAVSPALNRCELEHLERQEIDIPRAEAQHRAYQLCLASLGVRLLPLPFEPDLPDSMFVEDPAVVVDEVAVMTRMGVASRRGESEGLARALSPFRPLHWMREPATLEGGDVLRLGRLFLVGLSSRTNAEGAAQLAAVLEPFGYTVRTASVHGCLHLKSACTPVDAHTVLANRDWFDASVLQGFDILDVPPDEPNAANVLAIGDSVLMAAAFPRTARRLEAHGCRLRILDISELMKAESAMTCSSLLFETA